MKRFRSSWLPGLSFWLPGLALLASLPALAAGVPQSANAATTVSGVYTINFRLNIASILPAGTTITCRARIVPGQGEPNLRHPQLVSARVETAAGVSPVTGPVTNCTAEIPFAWTVASPRSGVMLSYEIDAITSAGGAPLVVRSSEQQNIQVALPSAGGSASLDFHVTL